MPYVAVNSANRTTGNDSNFTITFPANIPYSKFRLKNLQFMNCLYNVTSTGAQGVPINNHFAFQLRSGITVTNYDVTIAEGFYNLSAMITALTAAINTAISPLTCTITASAITNKLTFTFSGGVDVNILPLTQNQGLNLLLGFSRNSETGFSTGSVTAPRCYNMNRYSTLYLESNFSKTSSLSSGKSGVYNLFAIIPIDAEYGNLVSWSDDTGGLFYSTQPNVTNLTFTFTDAFGSPVDTNGLNITFGLECY